MLSGCVAIDAEGTVLLSEWQDLLGNGASALLSYAAVLRGLLPASYLQRSHHAAWGRVMSAALSATSPEAMEQVCVCA
jgi:hypothetical protein